MPNNLETLWVFVAEFDGVDAIMMLQTKDDEGELRWAPAIASTIETVRYLIPHVKSQANGRTLKVYRYGSLTDVSEVLG